MAIIFTSMSEQAAETNVPTESKCKGEWAEKEWVLVNPEDVPSTPTAMQTPPGSDEEEEDVRPLTVAKDRRTPVKKDIDAIRSLRARRSPRLRNVDSPLSKALHLVRERTKSPIASPMRSARAMNARLNNPKKTPPSMKKKLKLSLDEGEGVVATSEEEVSSSSQPPSDETDETTTTLGGKRKKSQTFRQLF